jgi:hypothetical protein
MPLRKSKKVAKGTTTAKWKSQESAPSTGSRRAQASSDSSATQQPNAKKQKGQTLEAVTDEDSDSSAAEVTHVREDLEEASEGEDEQLGE